MCGIYGNTKIIEEQTVLKKLERARFRGPDWSAWKQYGPDLILGHNRLSIIDLDPRSNQPFEYQNISIVFNGEIYNFQELRKELEGKGFSFSTSSDTEVICAAYLAYGRDCVARFNGMFAFVIFDRSRNCLFGARDRSGKKPFYYSLQDGYFEFASQPSQIAIGRNFEMDEKAVSQFFRWNYIPEPRSIYCEVKKLRAGHWFTYDLAGRQFHESKYWDLSTQPVFLEASFDEAKTELKRLLQDAVRLRMISDVPLGVFLSGGIDSSLVTALAQEQSSQPVCTFSVKFEEAVFDESQYAKQVADHLQTRHTEIHCNLEEGIDLIENFYRYYDEPFADASAIPSMLLAKYTRKHVTVALTGDAGDENFLGYKRYDKILGRVGLYKLPAPLRALAALGFSASPRRYYRATRPKGFLAKDINHHYYQKMTMMDDSWITDPSQGDFLDYYHFLTSEKPLLERVSDFDIKTYLVEDVNVKVDRACMAFSLEARCPLLDYRVVEYARQLPTDFKYCKAEKKHILKEILYQYAPKSIFDRPKRGFAMPLRLWFRDKMKDYVLDTLSDKNLDNIPNIDKSKVRLLTQEHMQAKENNYEMIWRLLVLINWVNHQS